MSNQAILSGGSPGAEIIVDPDQGGRLASFELGGRQLLVTSGDSPLTWGCYPMVPFAGRIAHGQLAFDDTVYQLPVVVDGHAIHGYGYTNAWDVSEAGATEVELVWAFSQPWPWSGSATQRFTLTANSLTMTMIVRAEQRQPVSFGWHPWFSRHLESGSAVDLGFATNSMYELDDAKIPTGEIIEPSSGPWDNCFTDVEQPIELRWDDHHLALTSSTEYWVVYDEPTHSLCVEPQTGVPNEVNTAPHILESGQSASAQFAISW